MRRNDLTKGLRLLLKPSLHAIIYIVCWNLARWYLEKRTMIDGEWAAAIIGGAFGLHALFGGFAIHRISNKQDTIELADALGDKDTFMFHRDRKSLDVPWRVLLLTFTLVLLGMSLFAPFAPMSWGMPLVAGGSFMLFVFWAVVEELDDPFSGIWTLRNRLYHPGWRVEDCHQYFLKKNQCESVGTV